MRDKEIYIRNVQAIGIEKFTRFCVEQFSCPEQIDFELCRYINSDSSCFECWKNYIEKKIAPCQEPNN
ncbi:MULTISPECIES: hypothetical protein [Clostridium]|uniref:Uncharacterized protein n=1 Tax=Clostridium botulinum B2 450 TaxID=1379739 RepID=A0A0D1A248_CLOBO|nr:hypothetical protein [Clostridium botulinum]KIS24903.1 hypothetical protein N495_15450 [Clostridium botulinum B2 450]MDU5116562.1 hypothetical protein [Clostridium botulinum]